VTARYVWLRAVAAVGTLLSTACDGGSEPPGYVGVLTLPSDEDAAGEEVSSHDAEAGEDARGPAQSASDAGSGATTSKGAGGGIGQICETNRDCPDGLMCREDATGYVAHHQCSRSCQSADECTGFAEGTMCIGAEVCTLRCRTDGDCPSKTHCIAAGWCKREGKGSGVPSCGGVSGSCFGRSAENCLIGLGCNYQSSRCSGLSESCFSQYSSIACDDVKGCTWSSSTSTCSGSSWSCGTLFSSFECSDQPGCSFGAESCSGVPTACSELSAGVCAFQPGCSLQVE
jgi:hypothetical protein